MPMGGATGSGMITKATPKHVVALRVNAVELAQFLVSAKKNGYSSGNEASVVQRPGFIESSFRRGRWSYRDSYSGFFSAPGQEVVYFDSTPVWAMSYSGGMVKKHSGNVALAEETFDYLKEALAKVRPSEPFRGPTHYHTKPNLTYTCNVEGDISNFKGSEQITLNQEVIFAQDYIGGIIIPRSGIKIIGLKEYLRLG